MNYYRFNVEYYRIFKFKMYLGDLQYYIVFKELKVLYFFFKIIIII